MTTFEGIDVALEKYIRAQKRVVPYIDGRIEDLAIKADMIRPINIYEPIHFGYNNSQEFINFKDDEIIIPQIQDVKVITKSSGFIRFLLKALCGPTL